MSIGSAEPGAFDHSLVMTQMINFSDLLWKTSRTKEARRRTIPFVETSQAVISPALADVEIDQAQIDPTSRIALLMAPHSSGADRFRFLRLRLRELRQLAKLQSIVITSPIPEDGKSTTAICLASSLAEGGKNSVLLIEADLHHPSLAKSLCIPGRPGVAECLEGGVRALSEIRKIEPLGWHLLQAGTTKGNPSELLQSDALPVLMQQVAPHFDWILVDSPPALPLTDAVSLCRNVDGSLLVARADRTPREAIDEALTLIGRKHIVGIILNGTEGLGRYYSSYYGHYVKP